MSAKRASDVPSSQAMKKSRSANMNYGTTSKPNDLLWSLIAELEKRKNAKVLFGMKPGEVRYIKFFSPW